MSSGLKQTNKIIQFIFLILPMLLFSQTAYAEVIVNEIMYNPKVSDEKHEWVEIINNSGSEVDITGWKFNDGSNHNLNIPPINNGQGSMKISGNGFAILASDAGTFL